MSKFIDWDQIVHLQFLIIISINDRWDIINEIQLVMLHKKYK